VTKQRKRRLTDDEIIASLSLSDPWRESSLGNPIGADGIDDEVPWSRFQRVCIDHAQTHRYPASGGYSLVPQVAYGRRARQPDISVRQGDQAIAMIDAKERQRLDKRHVDDVARKYSSLAPEVIICVPPRCTVTQSASREAARRGIDIVVVPFGRLDPNSSQLRPRRTKKRRRRRI